MRRRVVLAALVVILLALGALWRVLHVVRSRRESETVALCASAVGQDGATLDAAFARAGATLTRTGTFTTAYSRQSSYFQDVACLVALDVTGHARTAAISRLRRQEVWQPASGVPVWHDVIWPALVRASIPLTP